MYLRKTEVSLRHLLQSCLWFLSDSPGLTYQAGWPESAWGSCLSLLLQCWERTLVPRFVRQAPYQLSCPPSPPLSPSTHVNFWVLDCGFSSVPKHIPSMHEGLLTY